MGWGFKRSGGNLLGTAIECHRHTKDGSTVPRTWALSVGQAWRWSQNHLGQISGAHQVLRRPLPKSQLARSSPSTPWAKQEASGVRIRHRDRPITKAGSCSPKIKAEHVRGLHDPSTAFFDPQAALIRCSGWRSDHGPPSL